MRRNKRRLTFRWRGRLTSATALPSSPRVAAPAPPGHSGRPRGRRRRPEHPVPATTTSILLRRLGGLPPAQAFPIRRPAFGGRIAAPVVRRVGPAPPPPIAARPYFRRDDTVAASGAPPAGRPAPTSP